MGIAERPHPPGIILFTINLWYIKATALNHPHCHQRSQRCVWSGITWWLTTCHNKTPRFRSVRPSFNSSLKDRGDEGGFILFYKLSFCIRAQQRSLTRRNKNEGGRNTWKTDIGQWETAGRQADTYRHSGKEIKEGGHGKDKKNDAKGRKGGSGGVAFRKTLKTVHVGTRFTDLWRKKFECKTKRRGAWMWHLSLQTSLLYKASGKISILRPLVVPLLVSLLRWLIQSRPVNTYTVSSQKRHKLIRYLFQLRIQNLLAPNLKRSRID